MFLFSTPGSCDSNSVSNLLTNPSAAAAAAGLLLLPVSPTDGNHRPFPVFVLSVNLCGQEEKCAEWTNLMRLALFPLESDHVMKTCIYMIKKKVSSTCHPFSENI